ncbi:hypothetical protein [Achromobacter arsenitoxydans]|nr:hypothetical protein [Achromobacter arsenitoxydans]
MKSVKYTRIRAGLCRPLLAGAGAVALLVAPSLAAAACNFQMSATPLIRQVVKANGGTPMSDAQCAKLTKNNLRLHMNGEATVLAGVSVGWAIVTVSDKKTNLVSTEVSLNTVVNAKSASIDTAEKLLYSALENAIRDLDIDKANNALKVLAQDSRKR